MEGSAREHAKPREEWESGLACAFAGLFLKICHLIFQLNARGPV